MRLLSSTFAPASLGWLLCGALAYAATTYRDTVEGFQSASGEGKGVAVLLNASGDLPGDYTMTLRRKGKTVIGGSWTLTVFAPDAGATSGEKGTLTGGVTGGTLTFNGDGAVAGADSVRLTIQGGTGQYARVKGGGGIINLSSAADNPSQLTGILTLEF
jgi:hypothetical protein